MKSPPPNARRPKIQDKNRSYFFTPVTVFHNCMACWKKLGFCSVNVESPPARFCAQTETPAVVSVKIADQTFFGLVFLASFLVFF